jgi:hypothetical protein
MRAVGAVLIAIAVTVLIAVLVYVLAVLPVQRSPLEVPSGEPAVSEGTQSSESFEPTAPVTSSTQTRPIAFSELVVGTCLTDSHLSVDGGDAIDRLETIPCAAAHYEEVIALGDFAGDTYPGRDVLVDELDVACVDAFESYVKVDYGASALSLDYLLPTETSWIAGDRGYACLVFADSPLEGSVAGTAR